jgi:hypothetical protein
MIKDKPIHVKPSIYAFYFESLKVIALKYGYNLVLHGSMNRDLDLIAIPWQEKLGDTDEMVNDFATILGGDVMEMTDAQKNCFPHGRISYIININRGGDWNNHEDAQYYLDISVTPAGTTKTLK